MGVESSKPTVGVKAIIVRDHQLLTVVKRYPEGLAYILPGGGQEHGETLEAAIRRECYEELGAHVTVDRLAFVREYIGANHQYAQIDRHIHIVDIMFACHVADDYAPRMGDEPDSEQIGVQWLPIASLHEYQFYPRQLQRYLTDPETSIVYIGDMN